MNKEFLEAMKMLDSPCMMRGGDNFEYHTRLAKHIGFCLPNMTPEEFIDLNHKFKTTLYKVFGDRGKITPPELICINYLLEGFVFSRNHVPETCQEAGYSPLVYPALDIIDW